MPQWKARQVSVFLRQTGRPCLKQTYTTLMKDETNPQGQRALCLSFIMLVWKLPLSLVLTGACCVTEAAVVCLKCSNLHSGDNSNYSSCLSG